MKTTTLFLRLGLALSFCFSNFTYSHAASNGNEPVLTDASKLPSSADFDGVDDYVSRNPFLGGKSNVTVMTWIKLDGSFNGGDVIGQANFRLFIDANNRLKAYIKTDDIDGINSLQTPEENAPELTTEKWNHIALSYNGSRGEIIMYLNGKVVWCNNGLSGGKLNSLPEWNSNHDFEIGRNSENDNNYFEGDIYECRVYNKTLSESQIGQQIFQEIENNNGAVRGTVIPKDIDDLQWSDLELYYKMDAVSAGMTTDYSNSGIDGALFNMTTVQDRTAPMPYITVSSGGGNDKWTHKNNWLHGDVWNVMNEHSDYAIIVVSRDLTTSVNHKTAGLIIESGNTLEVTDDSGIYNSWYLKLDGVLDLQGESQLIQTELSELDPASSGRLERDQQGTADQYTYNYWSSPVSKLNATINNIGYTAKDVLFDGTQKVNFLTTGYDGMNTNPVSIADYWIWKFANKLDDDYSSWQHVRSTGTIEAGEGFTMKGPGSGSISEEQNYVFVGKPNNGNINLTINGGNDYLVGNPYPSAIDAHQFILDNAPLNNGDGATTGTLYFWEHWGGGSHNLTDYLGGYAIYNLSGGTPAASFGTNDANLGTGGKPTKRPGRYIPVSQGFFVVGQTDGTINFNNSQRVFQKEAVSSVFMEANPENGENFIPGRNFDDGSETSEDTRPKLRIGLNSINEIHRQLLVTVDPNATEGADWGYDGVLYETQMDDMYWMIDNEKYVIQGTNNINGQTVLPLGIHTQNDGLNSIMIDELEQVDETLDIYIHDKALNIYHDLRISEYTVFLTAGSYLDRFEITFGEQETLGNSENELELFDVHYSNKIESIVITNPTNKKIDGLSMINILGQSVFSSINIEEKNYSEYRVSGLSTGTYIIKVKTPQGTISKKVLVK